MKHIWVAIVLSDVNSDCGGKMCYNGGSLDYKTCACKCGSLYSGDSCQTCT